jgi:hypothetical protein
MGALGLKSGVDAKHIPGNAPDKAGLGFWYNSDNV